MDDNIQNKKKDGDLAAFFYSYMLRDSFWQPPEICQSVYERALVYQLSGNIESPILKAIHDQVEYYFEKMYPGNTRH